MNYMARIICNSIGHVFGKPCIFFANANHFFMNYFESCHRFIAVSSSLSQPRQAVMTVTMTQMITTSMNTMRSIFPATLSFEFLQSVFSFLGCSSKKQHMMIAVATMQTNTVWTRMIPVVYSILYLKKTSL